MQHSKLKPWKIEEDLSEEDGIYKVGACLPRPMNIRY